MGHPGWGRLVSAVLLSLLIFANVGLAQSQADTMDVPLDTSVAGDVEFWHFWGSPVRRNAIRRVIASCEQELPNVSVTDVFKPWGDIWTANIAAVAANSGMPDVIVSDRPQLARDAAEGIYQDLQARLDADGLTGEAFYGFTWDQVQVEGGTYGLPFETDVRVLFVNQTLLEAAGLDPAHPPRTWEELWQAADALDVIGPDGELERIAFSPLHGNGAHPDLWARTNGHTWVQDGRPVVDAPEVAETMAWIVRWIDRYGGYQNLQDFMAQFGAPPNDAFMSGAVAFKLDISGYTSTLAFFRPQIEVDGEQTRIDWTSTLPPYDEEPASSSGGFALSVPAGAENPEAAWEFIKCATSRPAQVSWARDTYSMPSRTDAASDPLLMADPQWAFFVDAMEVSQSDPFVAEYPGWGAELNNRLEGVWRGEVSLEEALREAQQAIDETIAGD